MYRYPFPRVSVLCLLGLCAAGAKADPRSIPPETFPAAFGVNIHYTQGSPGETAMLGQAFRVARMDFHWHATERQRGVYDFSAYDGLLRELEAQGVTPLFILDYGNDLYQAGPPRTPEARAAYARWAAAAAERYRGKKIMWEFWNEPNLSMFWGSLPPDPEEYARLVNEAAPAMRKADPKCTLLVGATSGFPWDWMETIMRRGVLRWADAFSVHPYRSGMPETVATDYARLRRMLHKHVPKRTIPILSGEWGYSTNTKTGIPEERQAQYLVRQRLVNASQGIRTSIWYDWKNDGPDPEENEHRFGSMMQDLKPKPSYTAARVMSETLAGYRFARMLRDGPDEYVMLLRSAKGETALALWTTGPKAQHTLSGAATVVTMEGDRRRAAAGESIAYGSSPVYVLFGKSAQIDAQTMWWWMRPHTVVEAGKRVVTPGITIRNTMRERRRFTAVVSLSEGSHDLPSDKEIELGPGEQATIPVAIRIMRRDPEARLSVTVYSLYRKKQHQWDSDLTNILAGRSTTAGRDAGTIDSAEIPLTVANPLTVTAGPADASGVDVTLESPMGGPENLTVELTNTLGLSGARPAQGALKTGQERVVVRLPVDGKASVYSYGVRVLDESGAEIASAPPVRFHHVITPGADIPVGGSPRGLSIHGEGDEKPGGEAKLTVQRDSERGMVADIRATFPDGWRYFVVTPEKTEIPSGAVAVGMWVNGDGSGDALRCRFIDAKGQTYQPTYGPIDWKGWRWVTMRLDDPSVGSWGGPQDGRINHPIQWDSIFLLDSANRTAHTAHVQFDDVTVLTKLQ